MPEMTPLEAAEKLKNIENHAKGLTGEDLISLHLAYAAMSKIASGEYALVIHGHWDGGYYPENGQWYFAEVKCSVCHKASYAGKSAYCPSCGALMGKDDSHEAD